MSYHEFLHNLKEYLQPSGWRLKYSIYDIINDNYKIDFYKYSALKNNKRIDAYVYLHAKYLQEYTSDELNAEIYKQLSERELESIK